MCIRDRTLTFKVGSPLDLTWEPVVQGKIEATDETLLDMYHDFLTHYEKDLTDKAATMERFSIFKQNLRSIISFNKDISNTWEMGVNEWTDLTDAEFELKFPLLPQGQECSATNRQSVHNLMAEENLPKFKDWRDAGVVPPVNNQGSCGSCWTFSTINTFESHYAIATNKRGDDMVRFS